MYKCVMHFRSIDYTGPHTNSESLAKKQSAVQDAKTITFHFFTLTYFSAMLQQFAQVRYQNDPKPLLSNMVKVSICHVTVM